MTDVVTQQQHGSSRQVQLPADCGKDLRVALAVSRFNEPISTGLLDGAQRALAQYAVQEAARLVVWVPGAFELPWTAQRLAQSGTYHAVICLGAVIRGATPHFDYVSAQAAAGIMQAGLHSDVPVLFGVLTCNDLAQAEARSGKGSGNRGHDVALAALEMVMLRKKIIREGR